MKNLNLILYIAIILTGVFSSCEREQITKTDENLIVNQKLKDVAQFSSQEQFLNSVEQFRNENVLPTEISHITSLSEAKPLKSETLGGDEEDTLICSDLLKHFLNEQYEIVIGNVFFRITKQGTFFTNLENSDWLKELTIDDKILDDCEPVTNALGYSIEAGMYKVSKYSGLYFYDTFRQKEPIDVSPGVDIQIIKSASFPSDTEWQDIDDGRTIAGKSWDNIWGFSKSVRNYFDSKHRVDVKFYAQRFPFYSEMGIKTKTQKKGWTGVWRKQGCDEIIDGWEVLNLKEKWPKNIFGPDFDPNNNHLPTFRYKTKVVQDLEYSQSRFLSRNWKTFDILGLDIDFSQKDKVGALWNACTAAGKASVKFLNNKFTNPSKQLEAIRLLPRSSYITTTKVSLAPFYDSRSSTDKYTMIIANSSGGTIGATYSGGNGLGFAGYKNLTAKYTFLQNTIMYGAARRGATWRGVRITFK
ncbi:hypothetical protein PbJCM13498_41160 [Prolixibacter bellariivorans]|uniref:Lipoprotein n=1 Tax=Prolixibacter bellariivorans TaxID=314319 RepID=A0A5M4B606_9BACT|nr:hypothetical protein [Prolixibacter bellariivorans]GET35253.1 hypothetical protein PbJCM13498_41160 [Prolixibacter bellariivorans]